jgi:cytochrome P450
VTAESPEIIERIPADFLSNPYDLFARLRSGPRACQVVMPHGAKVWMVTRYEDVRTLLSDPRISKDGRRMDEMYVRHSGTGARGQRTGHHRVRRDPVLAHAQRGPAGAHAAASPP